MTSSLLGQTRSARRKLWSDATWVALGQGLGALAALATIRLMTGALGPEAYGSLTLVIGLSALSSGLSVGPWFQAVIRMYSDSAREGRVAWLRSVSRRLLLRNAAIASAGLLLLAAASLSPATLATGMLLVALLVTETLRTLEIVLFNAARRQREAALLTAADAWARPLAAVTILQATGWGVQGALLGYLAGSLAVLLALRAMVRLEGDREGTEPVEPGEAQDLSRAMTTFALPLIPVALFGWLSSIGDRYVIGGLLGIGQVGIYAAAYGLVGRPFLTLSSAIELVYRPMLHDAVAAGDAALEARLKARWLLVTLAASAAITLLICLLGGSLVRLLLAQGFESATRLLPVLAVGHLLHNLALVFMRFSHAYKDTRAVMVVSGVSAALAILIAIPATWTLGLLGAALAVPVAYAFEVVLAWRLAKLSQSGYGRHR